MGLGHKGFKDLRIKQGLSRYQALLFVIAGPLQVLALRVSSLSIQVFGTLRSFRDQFI